MHWSFFLSCRLLSYYYVFYYLSNDRMLSRIFVDVLMHLVYLLVWQSSSRCHSRLILLYLHLTLLLCLGLWNSMSMKSLSLSSFAQAYTISLENMVQLYDVVNVLCAISVWCVVLWITWNFTGDLWQNCTSAIFFAVHQFCVIILGSYTGCWIYLAKTK